MIEFNWATIATVAGAGTVTTLLVQLIKHIGKIDFSKWWLRLVTYCISTFLLIAANIILGTATFGNIALCFINGALVYFVATGEYHTIIKELSQKKVQ